MNEWMDNGTICLNLSHIYFNMLPALSHQEQREEEIAKSTKSIHRSQKQSETKKW
jgi:hypothetical protein